MIQLEKLAEYPEIYKGYAEVFHAYMSRYRLLDVVFYDADRIITIDDIERLLLSASPYIIRYKSQLAGFVLLTNRHLYRAEITYCTWPPYWGRGSVERGKEVLKQLLSMEENKGLLNLYGFTLGSERAANRYAEQIGFQDAVNMGRIGIIFRHYDINRG